MSYVLVVDDEASARVTLVEVLRLKGQKAAGACNGAEALEVIRSAGPPCLILLDLLMPTMSGWQLRVELLGPPQLVDVPIIVVSGLADVAQHARVLRAAAYLEKPIDFDKLDGILARYCPSAGN